MVRTLVKMPALAHFLAGARAPQAAARAPLGQHVEQWAAVGSTGQQQQQQQVMLLITGQGRGQLARWLLRHALHQLARAEVLHARQQCSSSSELPCCHMSALAACQEPCSTSTASNTRCSLHIHRLLVDCPGDFLRATSQAAMSSSTTTHMCHVLMLQQPVPKLAIQQHRSGPYIGHSRHCVYGSVNLAASAVLSSSVERQQPWCSSSRRAAC